MQYTIMYTYLNPAYAFFFHPPIKLKSHSIIRVGAIMHSNVFIEPTIYVYGEKLYAKIYCGAFSLFEVYNVCARKNEIFRSTRIQSAMAQYIPAPQQLFNPKTKTTSYILFFFTSRVHCFSEILLECSIWSSLQVRHRNDFTFLIDSHKVCEEKKDE